jgi:hypothetical protein
MPNSKTARTPSDRAAPTSSTSVSGEKWYWAGIDAISAFTPFPCRTNNG